MTGRHPRDDDEGDAPDTGADENGRDDDRDENRDDDRALFRRLMADARRIESDRAPPVQRRPTARATLARRERAAVLRESLEAPIGTGGDEAGELRFQHPSVSRSVMRRLARGAFARQDEIDLHGLTRDAATAALVEFIADCVRRGHTCVRVVHGKGRGSGAAGPVLKRMVDQWLRRLEPVLAYVPARPVDGGSGAVYVLLRRQGPPRKE